jgi:non-specific serine/threonine protein kinase
MPVPPDPAPAARSAAAHRFGRWQLLRLLGKSARSMAWRVADAGSGAERVIVLPRAQPVGAAALERWLQQARQASRLSHSRLAAVVDMGIRDGWPYMAYDPHGEATLAERLGSSGLPSSEAAAALVQQALQGLAFAHEAGLAHHDVQPYLMLMSDDGQLRVAGLGVAGERGGPVVEAVRADPNSRHTQRSAAERDVLSAGVMLHGLLAGTPALDERDVGLVVERLPPLGGDIVRLPRQTTHPIAEPLRVIVNRATDRQERLRYRSARTLLRALEGWLQAESGVASSLTSLLPERLCSAGVLPLGEGAAARLARVAAMEGDRTHELAEVVLEDFALSFELLRLANSAKARWVCGAPVLTVRRAIAMLGLEGVRLSALALRDWPGTLDEADAERLAALQERVRLAAHTALALRPAGYDGEVVYLLTVLQNLGRLVLHHHFAEEAQQVARLMQSSSSPRAGVPEEPSMTEEAAAFAVLGVGVDAIGQAAARHCGFDESVLKMIQPLPLGTPVRGPDGDDDLLRATASCANEAVDALMQPTARVAAALQRVVQRYGRLLNFGLAELQEALRGDARLTEPMPLTQPAPLERAGLPSWLSATRRTQSSRPDAAP